MGLKSMEERVNLLGGELTIRSRPGEGTRIVVKSPYQQHTANQESAVL
jgi:signal transduction histidine kinase